MIEFLKLKLSNFLSIGNETVELDFKHGLNIITGQNLDKEDRTNGVGKSTILDGVFFCLYDSTLRKLLKGEIVNNYTNKNCLAELEFKKDQDHYRIVRGIKPSICELYINGENKTKDSAANTNEEILKIIGINEETFKNCAIMSIGMTKPFMDQKKLDKKKYIEGIFDLKDFSEIEKQIKKEIKDVELSLKLLMNDFENTNKILNEYITQSENFETDKSNKIETIKSKILQIKQQIAEKTKEVEKFANVNDVEAYKNNNIKIDEKLSRISDKSLEIASNKSEHLNNIRHLNSELNKLNHSEKCPTCQRRYDDTTIAHVDARRKEIKKSVEESNAKLEIIEQNIIKLNEAKTTLQNSKRDNNIKIQNSNEIMMNYRLLNNDIKNLQLSISQYDEQAEELKSQTNVFKDRIVSAQKELTNLEETKTKNQFELKTLQVCSFVFSEKGVKAYIVKKLLDLLNFKINYYLGKMNANCVIEFDEFFEEKIKSEKNYERSYDSFSSGEKRTIDISIMFALSDIQKTMGKFNIDIAFYDELIDSSLDQKGVECVMDILREKIQEENKKTYLITHRKDLASLDVDNVIFLEKINGITKLSKNYK